MMRDEPVNHKAGDSGDDHGKNKNSQETLIHKLASIGIRVPEKLWGRAKTW